jgi:Tfp pilus assembly protein PilE
MSEGQDTQVRAALKQEIEALERHYKTIREYMAGTQYDAPTIVGTMQAFKYGLNQVSAHIMTLYVLNKQKAKITWQPLLDNISNALETVQSRVNPNVRSAIEMALGMSEPNIQEVMAYLTQLKSSL